MQPFTTLTAVAAPIDLENIDTDRIIPARFLRKLRGPGYDRWLLHDMRFDADGNERPDFVLNRAPYRKAKILVTGRNFGCGSSREQAVYTLMAYGIRCVIAPSFGELHAGNQLQNGMLPVVLPDDACAALRRQLHERPGAQIAVDLKPQTVTAPDGLVYRFDIAATHKERLLEGLDDIALVLKNIAAIEAAEQRLDDEMPWLKAGS